jgi:hypothetical protein
MVMAKSGDAYLEPLRLGLSASRSLIEGSVARAMKEVEGSV